MKLSIAVVTMNREKQLLEALHSCIASRLPPDTQFVIIDNASTDATESVIAKFFKDNPYEYYYEKLPNNIGCGNGRNYAYLKSKGDYVYFMDDDAYIDADCKDFFVRAIEIFDTNKKIATLTTQIYDLVWRKNRVLADGPMIVDDVRHCQMLCGGSHFLSRSFFGEINPYFPNKYGYEEILPSIRVIDAGYVNAFVENLRVIHNPLVNKWDYTDKNNEILLIKGLAVPYAMKKKFYPKVVHPLVYAAYKFRCWKYLNRKQILRADEMVKDIFVRYEWGNQIKFKSICRMFKHFGFTIF